MPRLTDIVVTLPPGISLHPTESEAAASRVEKTACSPRTVAPFDGADTTAELLGDFPNFHELGDQRPRGNQFAAEFPD